MTLVRRSKAGCAALLAVLALATACGGAEKGRTELQASFAVTGPLFQSDVGDVISDGIVVIAGERVVCSGRASECIVGPEVPRYSAEGGLILPGLIDLHVHARPAYIGAFLPSGVTTIRDANNSLAVVDSLRTAGGPRVIASGPMLDGPGSMMARMSPTADRIGTHPISQLVPILVDDSASAAAAVDSLHASGVGFVKLYQTLSEGAFRGAAVAADALDLDVAVDLGMAFSGGLHGSEVDLVQAAGMGIATAEHLSGAALAYRRLGGDPFQRPFNSDLLDRIADAFVEGNVAAVPTLAVFEQLVDPHSLPVETAPGARLAWFFAPRWEMMEGLAREHRAAVLLDRDLTKALLDVLQRRDVRIGAGSDAPAVSGLVAGGGLHLELAALVSAGLTPAQALQAATANAAEIIGRGDLGHLRPGAVADILIIDGNATSDITATHRIRRVWYGGEEVDLDAAWEDVEVRMNAALGGVGDA